jgi:hypothetical protein
MKEFFTASPVLAWSIVSVMVALLAVSILWAKIKWWWHNTWYSFPLIGKISTLARDTNRDSSDPTWFKAEKTLCRDYKKFIRIQDEHDFNEKVTYLTKAGDNGRSATPGLIWVLTVALVFVEAMGFSYVLAGYTIPGASENLQQMGAYGIAFLISVILVAFTHFAGHELYKSSKIKIARQEWSESGRKGKTTSDTVPLARPQSIDDAQPSHVQLMNRVGTIPSYYATIGTTIFVVIVAIGATYVRGQVLEKQLHQQVVGQAVSTTELPAKLSKDGLDMSVKENRQGIKLPAEDAAQNKRATDKAQEDEASIDRHGGWGTFIVLAFIFVFLQILSIFFGFRWGFAGKDSESAYRAIGGGRYASYADVLAHHKDVADTAQSKLEHLQQKLMNNNTNTGTDGLHTTKTFYEFIDLERERETNQLAKEKQRTAQHADMEKRKTAGTYVQVSATDPMTEPATVTLDEAMRYLDKMGENKEDKKAYVRNLPDALQTEVIEALKGQQALKRDKELDDLLG